MKGISHMVRENSMGLPVGARAVLALSPTFSLGLIYPLDFRLLQA